MSQESGAATVFFTDMRGKKGAGLLDKIGRLFDQAKFANIIQPGDLVAIKIHFGEYGNTSYIRPQLIRRIVDKVKEVGGKPFLTDANTLYVGSRSNSVEHLQTAIANGFDYAVVGAPLIIADGLNGKDYVNVPIAGKHFQEVKIASAIHHADVLLAVSHFKGHEATGFGGAMKNIGMGSGSRSGKQMMHSDLLPVVMPQQCKACGRCLEWCPGNAIELGERAAITPEVCIGCGECTVTCPHQAIKINWKTDARTIQEKICEYTLGAIQPKKGKVGFINVLMDITPDCDCCSWSDAPIIGDVGILASQDLVALEKASLDLINQQAVLSGTRLPQETTGDKFLALHGVDGTIQITYGEHLGLGTSRYNLIKL